MPVIAIPVVIEGIAVGGAWAYRAYQAYRAARLAAAAARAAQALEEMEAAQSAAKPDDKAEEKTPAQTKADAAASADCKNCNEDPDCQTARDKVKEALYGTKGEGAQNRGLAERLCHWLHGTSDAQNSAHKQAVEQAADRVNKAMKWLAEGGDRPVGKKEGATLTKKEKNKKLKDCYVPKDLAQDADDLLKEANAIANDKPTLPRMPRADFAAACTQDALGLVKKALGK